MTGPALTLLDGVRWHGEPIPGDRAASLLAALALASPHAVAAERLIAEVWDDDEPAHPEKALQVLVSRVRSRTSAEVIGSVGGGYRLGLAEQDVDALWVRAQVARAVRAAAAGDHEVAGFTARAALESATSAAAAGPLGELALMVARERDRARRVLGSVLLTGGAATQAFEVLEPILAAQPDDEELLAQVLRAEAQARGVSAALARYGAYAESLRDRLGTDPGERLRRLHLELLARDAPVRAGLHYDPTPLVGRDESVRALRSQLQQHRVVSVVGPGGLGKTRMAHLIGRLADEPAVHFVELAGLTSPDGVLPQVAQALGVLDSSRRPGARRGAGEPDLWTRLVAQLSAPTLLILDNAEHVVGAVAEVAATLVALTDTVRVLTTTRTPLGIAAEHVYQLPQLPEDDAVELFSQRARAARASVRLDRAEMLALVTRLDGLPLAIELAAAKTRAMSVAEITRRLQDRFALLTEGDRSAPDRHRTLEAVIAWSWNLLRRDDQRALRTLAAFPDGFSLAAAEDLLGADAAAQIGELVDQSLLVVHESGEQLRYRFLETVREFGLRELAAAGLADEVHRAVRDWGLAFTRRQALRLFSPDQIVAVHEVAAEAGNLTALLREALDADDAGSAVTLVGALSGYWTIVGEHFSMLTFAPALLRVAATAPLPAEDERPVWRAVLAGSVALMSIFTASRHEDGLRVLEELGAAGDRGAADAFRTVVLASAASADPRERLEALAREGDRDERVFALNFLGHSRENAGDIAGSFEACERALELIDDSHGPWARAQLQTQLCSLCASQEDLPAAARYGAEALPVIEAVRATDDATQVRLIQVLAELGSGRVVAAESAYAAMVAAIGEHETDLDTRLNLSMCRAELELARGEIDLGLRTYASAARLAEEIDQRFHRDLPAEALTAFEPGRTPWSVYPRAVVVFAHTYHGRAEEIRDEAERLAETGFSGSGGVARVDFPVSGAMFVASGSWQLVTGADPEPALRRIAMGRVFGYPRFQPVFGWGRVLELVSAHELEGQLDRLIAEFAELPFERRLEVASAL